MSYIQTHDFSVGYQGKALIHDINISLEKGQILALIGPNGAGKSTILKSITRHLQKISGKVYVQQRDLHSWTPKEMANHLAVVLTDRITPELMTCRELVAMGRYPHTNAIGHLTPADRQKVTEALELVHAEDLAEREFTTLSDGQKQRILLARAICQDTEIIILDEPTAYLDIRYKIEFLEILRRLARQKQTTILLSLHEIDLACKVADRLLCVKGDTVYRFGSPDDIMQGNAANLLYDMALGTYDPLFGSVELMRPEGTPRVFVIGGGGTGISQYRALQRAQIPFVTGILYENDLDWPVAKALAQSVLSVPAFETVPEETLRQAISAMRAIGTVLYSGCPIKAHNGFLAALLQEARSLQLVGSVSEIG